MTLREFRHAVAGYNERQKASLRLAAWHAANVMNPHTKRKITPKRLLGSEVNFRDKAEAERYFREAAERQNERDTEDVG